MSPYSERDEVEPMAVECHEKRSDINSRQKAWLTCKREIHKKNLSMHLESDQHASAGHSLLGVVGGPSAIVAERLLPWQVVLVQHRPRVLSSGQGDQGNQ